MIKWYKFHAKKGDPWNWSVIPPILSCGLHLQAQDQWRAAACPALPSFPLEMGRVTPWVTAAPPMLTGRERVLFSMEITLSLARTSRHLQNLVAPFGQLVHTGISRSPNYFRHHQTFGLGTLKPSSASVSFALYPN